MISFANDYLEGAHPHVLKRLMETNMIQETGYGTDRFSEQAKAKIREVINCPDAAIHFLVGGTQTNQIVIDSMLSSYEGVIAANTGHISTHEAGAIEFSRHKVLEIPSEEGKIFASDVKKYVDNFYEDSNHEHMVFPGMVYVSYPTEYGTLYSKKELEELSKVCHDYDIPFYIDGARLGYGLVCDESDVTISDIADFCDVFYIGGTKIGALCGEAVIFTKNNEPKHFTTIVKQHGALLAKGRLVGIQFLELFTENLYFDISQHAINMAMLLKKGLEMKGYTFYIDSPTNQQFIIMTNRQVQELQKRVSFSCWESLNETSQIIRFATSWGTMKENVEELLSIM